MAEMSTKNNGPEELDTELIHIILSVPKDTVTISVDAKLLLDGKLETARWEMSAEEFRRARQDFLDEVDDGDEYDGVWSLTEEGKEYVERLLKGAGE